MTNLLPEKTENSKFQIFSDLILQSKNILILSHDNPDPDSFISGYSLYILIKKLHTCRITLAYDGIVGRVENQAMLKQLKIPFKKYSYLKNNKYDLVILIDTQYKTGNNPLDFIPKKLIAFDHHPLIEEKCYSYFDINPSMPATAIIIYSYLEHFNIQVDQFLSAGFVYAVKTETNNLERGWKKEYNELYLELFRNANKKILSRIENAKLPAVYFKTLVNGLNNTFFCGSFGLTNCSKVPNPEFIPEICDLLLRYEKATWILAIGYYKKKVFLSIRTTNPRKDAGLIIRQIIKGYGTGGGHKMSAGAKISTLVLSEEDFNKIRIMLESRFLKLLKKECIKQNKLIEE